jgi:hypothetical protein
MHVILMSFYMKKSKCKSKNPRKQDLGKNSKDVGSSSLVRLMYVWAERLAKSVYVWTQHLTKFKYVGSASSVILINAWAQCLAERLRFVWAITRPLVLLNEDLG